MADIELPEDNDTDDDAAEGLEEALELDTQSQIFLEMRRQNLDLLKLAIDVAGPSGGGPRPPMKSGDVKSTLKNIWDVYSEFYTWIDPEESDGDDEDEDFEE